MRSAHETPSDDLKWLVEHPDAIIVAKYHDVSACWELIAEARKEILRLRGESQWAQLAARFRKLGDKTGMEKLSSYTVGISIGGDGSIYVEVGGYDIPGWPRHKEIGTFNSEGEALVAFEKAVVEAEMLVAMDDDQKMCNQKMCTVERGHEQDLQDRRDDEDGVNRTIESLGFIGTEEQS